MGELAGRFNRFRARKINPADSVRARELKAIDSFKEDKSKLQETAAARKETYDLEKLKMEAARAKLSALQPYGPKCGRKPKEVKDAIKEYNESKHSACKAEQLYKETLSEIKEKDTLEYALKTLAGRSGRNANNGFG